MELIIDIPDELYKKLKTPKTVGLTEAFDQRATLVRAIANGTPLPKGHDRLVEAKAVIKALFAHQTIDDVPTIIEADKESDNE